MKYLITFEKGEACRWLGHLDILRTFERAIRRADLPIAFSSGFNPRERIAFANALSVGVTASFELAILEFVSPITSDQLVFTLNQNLPPGIQLSSAELIDDAGFRDILNSYTVADLEVQCVFQGSADLEVIEKLIAEFLARTEIQVVREREGKKKSIDIRPFIVDLRCEGFSGNRMIFNLLLTIGNEGSAKPAEVITQLASLVPGIEVRRVHRRKLLQTKHDATN